MRTYLLGTIALWVVGATVLRTTLVPAQECPIVDPARAEAAAIASADWIVRALQDDDTYLYEYNRETNTIPDDYNVVRHAGVTMSLYQIVVAGYRQYLAPADRGLDYMERNLYRRDGWAAFKNPDDIDVQLGASALMLAGLTQRRIATNETTYDGLMREVGRYLLVMQRPDGSFLANWSPATGKPDPRVTSKYATGEAFWALAMMHEAFPSEAWDVPTRLVADYLSTRRDEVEDFNYPPWADQWAAYGLAEMGEWGLNEDNVAYARSLAARFGFLIRVESQRTDSGLSNLIHGRRARAAGMGTWVEALGSLWRLAGAEPRLADLQPDIAERAVCGVGMLQDRQQKIADVRGEQPSGLIEGAWFTNGVTRMDDQQHALSALIRGVAILEARQ